MTNFDVLMTFFSKLCSRHMQNLHVRITLTIYFPFLLVKPCLLMVFIVVYGYSVM
jgi:hypothetical protein